MTACETFPNAVLEDINDEIEMRGPQNMGVMSPGLLDSLHRIFALTHLSDTCIASAAIAEEFHGLGFVQSDYMAGHWKEHFRTTKINYCDPQYSTNGRIEDTTEGR